MILHAQSQIRVYTKKPGCPPDFEDGIILRNGVTVKHVCHAIHRTLPAVFKFALVWVSWKQLRDRGESTWIRSQFYRARVQSTLPNEWASRTLCTMKMSYRSSRSEPACQHLWSSVRYFWNVDAFSNALPVFSPSPSIHLFFWLDESKTWIAPRTFDK